MSIIECNERLSVLKVPESSREQVKLNKEEISRWEFNQAQTDLPIIYYIITIVFIDEVEGVNRRITDEAGGRVCNPTISPRHRGDK